MTVARSSDGAALVAGSTTSIRMIAGCPSGSTWPSGAEWVYSPDQALSAGTPWEGRQVRIVDGAGRPGPVGTVGLVRLRSLGVLPGRPIDAGGAVARLGVDDRVTTDDRAEPGRPARGAPR